MKTLFRDTSDELVNRSNSLKVMKNMKEIVGKKNRMDGIFYLKKKKIKKNIAPIENFLENKIFFRMLPE